MWWREKKWANVLNYYYLLGAFLSPLYVVIAFGCSSCCQHDEWEFSNPESKPGKHSHVRGRKRGSHFQNLLLLQGPKKTEFRGNSSSWGCCIRVIEKSHIFQQGSFHEIATKEQYSSNLKLSLKLCYILNMNTQKYNEHFFRWKQRWASYGRC